MKCSKLFFRSIRSFIRDEGTVFAASISFYFIMALVPFSLVLLTVMGFFIGENPALQDFVIEKILETFPDVTRKITDEFAKLVSYKGIGIVSFFIYAFLSFQFMKSVEFSLNTLLNIQDKRAIHHSIFVSFGLITLIIIIFIFSFGAATLVRVPPVLKQFLPQFEINILTSLLLRFILPLTLIWLIVTLLYLVLPLKRPRVLYAFKAALFVSIMLELAKHLFTWYIGSVTLLGRIYGSLTAFIIFFLWVYYSSLIFLLGAEMIAVMRDRKEEVHAPTYW